MIEIIINFITDSPVPKKPKKQYTIQYNNKNKYNFRGDNYTNASITWTYT